jgi:predicted nucleic acid-binding protein
MIVLDTNVISELMRPEPASSVAKWAQGLPASDTVTTTISQAEILYGVARLPPGRRRDALAYAATQFFDQIFARRILPFDPPAAQVYANILAARERDGRPISAFDAMIAAIARSRNAGVATRNTADFHGCGVDVTDPWSV